MPNARSTVPGSVHHVISRFIDREFLVTSSNERARYLQLLGRALTHSDWKCVAFALMSNHFHFAMVAGEMPCESWTRRTNGPFATWFNETHARIGPMFASRANIWVTRSENVASVIAYIHNNPVRAGVVAVARGSSWTSHRAYLGEEAPPPWLALDEGFGRCGLDARTFDDWVASRSGMKVDDPSLERVKRAVRGRGAIVLGTPQRDPLVVPLLARRFAHIRPEPQHVVEVVASVLGIPPHSLRGQWDRNVRARAIAAQTGKALGLTYSAMAAAMGHSPQTAARLGSIELSGEAVAAVEVAVRRLYGAFASNERNDKAS